MRFDAKDKDPSLMQACSCLDAKPRVGPPEGVPSLEYSASVSQGCMAPSPVMPASFDFDVVGEEDEVTRNQQESNQQALKFAEIDFLWLGAG